MKRVVKAAVDTARITLQQHTNKNLGLVTNNVAVTASGMATRQYLQKSGFRLTRLFSPEHGLNAAGEDGAAQEDIRDPLTGLPVVSLYGAHMKPIADRLKDIELMLFDIPDVGCRFYTYLWTLTYVMEACAENNIPLTILDRPNPIGGDLNKSEGPLLDEIHCSSFIGRWCIPVRHSCTLGELARYFAATRLPTLQLEVIPVENWERNDTALSGLWPFIPTSPAITDATTALVYPGTGLLEGIYINEGRGTGKPFTRLGAPWIEAEALNAAFNNLGMAGIQSSAIEYIPSQSIYANELCYGIQLQVTDIESLRPVTMGIQLLQLLIRLYSNHVMERKYYTAANPSGEWHLDKLLGIKDAFHRLHTTQPFTTSIAPAWQQTMQPWLLY